ncbi:porin [Verminephrobacter eiseniae]|uniref:porin n=1 Tax=Verminephrobacter eiseniae TaxID=364317 RepID=UPI002237284A|nr:porin [Verminephrobacter eiseniae]MCW5261291.1 porin [Verminephrobacter eiseniae]
MKKTAALCALLASAPVIAQTSSLTLYGIVDLGLHRSRGITSAHAPATGSQTSLGSGIHTTSRWGLRGSEVLSGDTRVLFNLESGVRVDSGAPGMASKSFDRASWVGLQGGWGSVQIGRQTSLLADAIAPVDPLGLRFGGANVNAGVVALSRHGLGADFGNAGSNSSSYRLDNAFKYIGQFGGFTARAMLGLGEVAGQASALASRGLGLAYAANGWTVSGAFQTFKDADRRSLNGSTLGLAYQWNSLRLAANAGRNEAQTAAGTHTGQRVLSSGVIWTAQPALNLGLTYYHAGRSRTGAHKDGYGRWVTFAEYKLSRRTQLYAELDSTRWRDGYQGAANPATATGIAAGVVHRF